jgi:lipoprotein NlpI
VTFNDRGFAYDQKGDQDHAIADYTEAIRLNPKFGKALRRRGYTHFRRGDFSAAASDMLRATELTDNPYAMLWRFLARGRMGEDAGAELSANAARLKTKDWPYPVIDFSLGRRTPEETRASASTPEEKCEAAFYIAEWHLLRGNTAEAKDLLQDAAADVCSKSFTEYAGAIAELKRFNQLRR